MAEKTTLSANEAWKRLLEKYPIAEMVEQKGVYKIRADQIREFREPRLMAKWDSSDALPEALRRQKLNLLPDSRTSYVMGDFLLYQEIPELHEHVARMTHVDMPEYESIDVNNISSEANAIYALTLSGILDDFLGDGRNDATFNGRMGTGVFDFRVNTVRGIPREIHVENAQCEIDGGFENARSVVIMEAKNVVHPDFHIRQLYYPYRLWRTRVKKPIRLVFSVYSNMIYRLFEYRFADRRIIRPSSWCRRRIIRCRIRGLALRSFGRYESGRPSGRTTIWTGRRFRLFRPILWIGLFPCWKICTGTR